MGSRRGTTNSQPADHKARLANTDRNPLPRFAAVADAGIQRHVIANPADLFQRGGAIPDECRPFDGCTDFAVFYAVRRLARITATLSRVADAL